LQLFIAKNTSELNLMKAEIGKMHEKTGRWSF